MMRAELCIGALAKQKGFTLWRNGSITYSLRRSADERHVLHKVTLGEVVDYLAERETQKPLEPPPPMPRERTIRPRPNPPPMPRKTERVRLVRA